MREFRVKRINDNWALINPFPHINAFYDVWSTAWCEKTRKHMSRWTGRCDITEKLFLNGVKPHSINRRFMKHLQQMTFENIVTKKGNCSKQPISHFATIFSTFFNNYAFIYRDLPYCCVDIFKVCLWERVKVTQC